MTTTHPNLRLFRYSLRTLMLLAFWIWLGRLEKHASASKKVSDTFFASA